MSAFLIRVKCNLVNLPNCFILRVNVLASDQNPLIFIFLHIFTVKKKAELSTGSKSSLSGSFHGI